MPNTTPTHRKPGLARALNADKAKALTNGARAMQRSTRQSPYKVRLVVDQIRGKSVNEALALLHFSKKHAARREGRSVDTDRLYVIHAVVNEGPKLKRFTPAAMGRATPVQKRTSHVEIVVAEKEGR